MLVDLQSGGRLQLLQDKEPLKQVYIGLSWGSIHRNILFGLVQDDEPVDLDSSVAVFGKNGELLYTVFFDKLESPDEAIVHSGDDRDGTLVGDDEADTDNEIISIDFDLINKRAKYIAVLLNSYDGHDFGIIPFARLKVAAGTPTEGSRELATFNLARQSKYSGYTAMLMGMFTREPEGWVFQALGHPLSEQELEESIAYVQERYVINH